MRDILTSTLGSRFASLKTAAFDGAADVVDALRELLRAGALAPGKMSGGYMREQCEDLSNVAALDLSLVRLMEGHLDALSILTEAGAAPRDGALYGVWAAEPPGSTVFAEPEGASWRLRGTKRFCSGAIGLDRALVTARAPDGARLFDVDLRTLGTSPVRGSWPAVGMAGSGSLDVTFDMRVGSTSEVGEPGFYLGRSGFWHGAVRVSACWLGGALGCARMLRARFALAPPDPHAAAHFGAVLSDCHSMWNTLDAAARDIDACRAEGTPDPHGQERALLVRQTIEQGCQRVLAATGRASGSSPLAFDVVHARRAADLILYLRQHHAERDLVSLTRQVLGGTS